MRSSIEASRAATALRRLNCDFSLVSTPNALLIHELRH
jgi:hypothetical protein